MKKAIAASIISAFVMAAPAFGGTHPEIKETEQEVRAKQFHQMYDHPQTQVVNNSQLKVDITRDSIMHSCCMPPNLVVSGKITNVGPHPIDYVHLAFQFEDKHGKVLQTERMYNNRAASLNDDEQVMRVLGEKPHFTPINPGETDTFVFEIPCPMLPTFDKVELYTNDMRP